MIMSIVLQAAAILQVIHTAGILLEFFKVNASVMLQLCMVILGFSSSQLRQISTIHGFCTFGGA